MKALLVAGLLLLGWYNPAAAEEDYVATQFWVKDCRDILKNELCMGYFIALQHGSFYAEYTQKRPLWCASNASIYQQHAVVMKFARDNPKFWNEPFFAVAVAALSRAFPCLSAR